MKTEGKYCPLIKENCKGYSCAFAAQGTNTSINEEGHFVETGTYHYCLVRDFMITVGMG